MGTPLMAAEAPPETRLAAPAKWPAIGFAIAAVVVVLDQLTKWLVLGPLGFSRPQDCVVNLQGRIDCGAADISPVVDFTMVWNRGMSYGLFQADNEAGRWAFVAFAAVIVSLLGYWLWRTVRPLSAIALGLVIGGAIGNNLIDRVRFGAVADFIDAGGPWFGWRIGGWDVGFPWVFNVADAAISVGAAFWLLELLLESREPR